MRVYLFYRPTLVKLIDNQMGKLKSRESFIVLNHDLVLLSKQIDWESVESEFALSMIFVSEKKCLLMFNPHSSLVEGL